VVCAYWQIGEQLIGTQEFLLEQILSSNGVEISTSSSFSRLQTSGEKYCRVLMSPLLMIHWQCNGANGNRYVSFRCGVEEAMSWALGQDAWNYKQN
jgi:hypothetical protein